MIYEFPKHLFISFCQLALRCLFKKTDLENLLDESFVILAGGLLFLVLEKSMKEEWIQLDTSNRTQKTYMKTLGEITFPIFIADISGKLEYCNEQACEIVEKYRKFGKETTKQYHFLT